MNENKRPCPQFPFWGAKYPDACCVNGRLYDLDRCDENGNLCEPMYYVLCPFCHTEDFIESDPFGWVDQICEKMEENGDVITDSMEQYAKQRARQAYLDWIEKVREIYD